MRIRHVLRRCAAVTAVAVGIATPIWYSADTVRAQVGAGALGYDISWPQCGQAYPPPSYDFGIVGVNGGRPFTPNACLSTETSWGLSAPTPVSVYANVDWPTPARAGYGASGPAGTCASGDWRCVGYNYGFNSVSYAVNYAASRGIRPQTWWLDIETSNNWSTDTVANARDVQGAIDGFRLRGLIVGAYSTPYQWGQITGSSYKPSIPSWVAGPESIDFAQFYCSPSHSFTGGPVWLVQYPHDRWDGDLACTTESGWPSPATWHPAASLGFGPLAGAPQAVSNGQGHVDVFWKGTDGGLWHGWYDGGWHGPQRMGGVLASDPHPVSWGPGHIDVFWQGMDGKLWHDWYLTGTGWSGPQSLGGSLASDPRPVSWGQGHIDVFWKGTDGGLWHTWFMSGWHGPESLGVAMAGAPYPVSAGPGNVDVFWRGSDANLWHKWYAQGWNGPENLGYGPLGSDPHPTAWQTGHIEVLWRGTDNGLWEGLYAVADGWLGPRSLGGMGSVGSQPAPTSWGTGNTDAFWVGTDGNLWHRWNLENLGDGPLGSAPTTATWGPGFLDVFWKGTDGNLWHTVYS